MGFTPIGPLTFNREPLTNITPFTYGDGYTYLKMLEDLKKTVSSIAVVVNDNNGVWDDKLRYDAFEIYKSLYSQDAALEWIDINGFVDKDVVSDR